MKRSWRRRKETDVGSVMPFLLVQLLRVFHPIGKTGIEAWMANDQNLA